MTNVVTARISDELLAKIDELAELRDRSRSWVIGKLLDAAVDRQLEWDRAIQIGLEDIEAGRTIPHERVVEEILNRRKQRAAA